MAEIVPVVSESLEAQVRNLLPSQRGFGEDLQASNVILPIIDLTNVAEGTNVPTYQQQAIAFGSQTAFSTLGATTTLANSPGFYRVIAASTVEQQATANSTKFSMTDGLSTKDVWEHSTSGSTSADSVSTLNIDFVFFLPAGITLSSVSSSLSARLFGSIRQVADVNGNPVNPVGFTPQ